MKNKATLTFNDKVHDLNLICGSENEVALDISRLRQEAKLITIDAGFKNTGSCQSAITFLDGENGILRYRGYSIEELANNANFLEVDPNYNLAVIGEVIQDHLYDIDDIKVEKVIKKKLDWPGVSAYFGWSTSIRV